MSKYRIEGRVDGQWSAQHAGAVDESTQFDSRSEAEDEIPALARALECDESDLRVVEI